MADTENQSLNVLSLCAGYGGIELGLDLAGLRIGRCVYVEREAYAAAVLVKAIEAGELAAGVVHTDLENFPAEKFRGCFDIIVGGYPCQPFSCAGRRGGKDDEHGRHLWPHIQRAIGFIQPRLCFFENVEGHLTLGFKDVCHDLGELGYELTAGLFSASECGAPHQRKRIFILAHRKGIQCDERPYGHGSEERPEKGIQGETGTSSSEMAHGQREGLEGYTGLITGTEKEKRDGTRDERTTAAGSLRRTQWPAGRGEPQHEWEQPRVVGGESVGDTKCAQRRPNHIGQQGEENQASGETSASGGSMGNTASEQNHSGKQKHVGETPTGGKKKRRDASRCGNAADDASRTRVGDTSSEGFQKREASEQQQSIPATQYPDGKQDRRKTEPRLGISTHGGTDSSHSTANYMGPTDNRIERLRMLGNGVVPATAAKAFVTLWKELNPNE